MNLTVAQVLSLAPDASSAAAGKKLAGPKNWQNVGQSATALWGACQGSALYQIKIDLGQFAYNCTCPSRKLPCKHVIGLLLLAAEDPSSVPTGDDPDWVSEWLEKRASRAEQREKKAAEAKPADASAQAKRALQRERRVGDGVELLDIWLNDLVRNGIAGLETQPPSFWEDQARRLVDAQAPGLANRVRRLGECVGAGADWPTQLLDGLGKLALLSHAFGRFDQLNVDLQADVRSLIGWTVATEDLPTQGQRVSDTWNLLGQTVQDEDRLRVQRTWLLGTTTERSALILQFSAAGQPFAESLVAGTQINGELVFWPSAVPLRARFHTRTGETVPITELPPTCTDISAFLAKAADALAKQPWLDRWFCFLAGATPTPRAGAPWLVRDVKGEALPLAGKEHWNLLAHSGGRPVILAAEWNGQALTPLSIVIERRFYAL
jgi:hypothetical protein